MASHLRTPPPLSQAPPLSHGCTTISSTFRPLRLSECKGQPWLLAVKSSKAEATLTQLKKMQEKSTKEKQHQEKEEELLEEVQYDETEEEIEKESAPLSERWREIQGENHWNGLFDPMDGLLRREIIRYGEFAQACYDAFDFDPYSKYCGTCKYTGGHFFEKLGMADSGHDLSRYLYATSNINLRNFFRKSKLTKVWSTHANWMGYVAVTMDPHEVQRLGRRDVVIAWRGTVTYLEWLEDLMDYLAVPGFGPDGSVKVESGFLDLYTQKEHSCNYCSFSAREQVLSDIRRLMERYKDDEHELSITVTGHSLGGALALLSAYDIAETGLNILPDGRRAPVTVFSFGAPRVGNRRFRERCKELGVSVLRTVNVHDSVPKVPGVLVNEHVSVPRALADGLPWSYAHVGVELALDDTKSPFLKPGLDPASRHNMELHLHLVDGHRGPGHKFLLADKRDVALLNKSGGLLRDEYGVPPNWRQDENKGMVRGPDGRYVVPERPRIDAHPPDTAHHLQHALKIVDAVTSSAAAFTAKSSSPSSASTSSAHASAYSSSVPAPKAVKAR
ncbi:hypothetical protein AMTRI_Chr01g104610 [Amborella trichopoda]